MSPKTKKQVILYEEGRYPLEERCPITLEGRYPFNKQASKVTGTQYYFLMKLISMQESHSCCFSVN